MKLVVFFFYMPSASSNNASYEAEITDNKESIFGQLIKKGDAMSPTDKISYPSLAIGIPKAILYFEMAPDSILHLYAYPYDVFQM